VAAVAGRRPSELEQDGGVLRASKRLWKVPTPKGHFNERWPFVAFHACSEKVARFAVER
jgi:hypothetical protein